MKFSFNVGILPWLVLALLVVQPSIAVEVVRPKGDTPPKFPPQFIVSTGTTIPFGASIDPVAQSGVIYYDAINNRARVDHFWMGSSRSFIVNLEDEKQRGYLVSNTNGEASCKTLRLTGRLAPFTIPALSVRHTDAKAVRGVPVDHYTAVEIDGVSTKQVDYYIKSMRGLPIDAEAEGSELYHVPWRIETARITGRRRIAPAPATNVPNWRFFGEPEDDAQQRPGEDEQGGVLPGDEPVLPSRAIISRIAEDTVFTVDFFNFVPITPDPAVFVPPATCPDIPAEEFDFDVDVHQTQQLLIDMSFNTQEGRRLHQALSEPPSAYGIGDKAAAGAA